MTRRIERKCWAESLCVEPSGQKCCAEGSTPFPNLGFFYGKRLFFIIEEATQTSILCRETLAPEAAPPMQILARSNFERTIRSLGPIPSNLQVIYHQWWRTCSILEGDYGGVGRGSVRGFMSRLFEIRCQLPLVTQNTPLNKGVSIMLAPFHIVMV